MFDPQSQNQSDRLLGGIILAGGTAIAGSASAGDVTVDFGNIGADGGAICSSGCVIPGAFEHTFTIGAVTVGAIGYMAGGVVGYVTQKPGSFEGPGETGIGESDVYNDFRWVILPQTATGRSRPKRRSCLTTRPTTISATRASA